MKGLAASTSALGVPTALCTERKHQARAFGLIVIALGAIMIGVAAYALLRPQPAMFLPSGWHRPQPLAMPLWLLATLPTFVHALAMPLLLAVAVGSGRIAVLRAICTAWCMVEMAFELAQHMSIRPALLAGLQADPSLSIWLAPLANFLRRGSFDPFDIAAAGLASVAACAILLHARTRSDRAMEAHHAQNHL